MCRISKAEVLEAVLCWKHCRVNEVLCMAPVFSHQLWVCQKAEDGTIVLLV